VEVLAVVQEAHHHSVHMPLLLVVVLPQMAVEPLLLAVPVAMGLVATLITLEARAVIITVKTLHLAEAEEPQISLALVEPVVQEVTPHQLLGKVVPAVVAVV
jgi:hypothetical protein